MIKNINLIYKKKIEINFKKKYFAKEVNPTIVWSVLSTNGPLISQVRWWPVVSSPWVGLARLTTRLFSKTDK
jgi:hypothetical protein